MMSATQLSRYATWNESVERRSINKPQPCNVLIRACLFMLSLWSLTITGLLLSTRPVKILKYYRGTGEEEKNSQEHKVHNRFDLLHLLSSCTKLMLFTLKCTKFSSPSYRGVWGSPPQSLKIMWENCFDVENLARCGQRLLMEASSCFGFGSPSKCDQRQVVLLFLSGSCQLGICDSSARPALCGTLNPHI